MNSSQRGNLPNADNLGWTRKMHHSVAVGPNRTLRSSLSDGSKCSINAAQSHRRSRRGAGAGAGGSSRAAAPLINSECNLGLRRNTHKFNVRAMWKERAGADLRAKLLP